MSEQQLAVQPEPSVGGMLAAVINKGVTTDNVAALEKLCDLYERDQARCAKQAFTAAFAQMQAEIPRIKATKPVPNKDGSIRYSFAPFEEIMAQVQPLLNKYGFAVRFNSKTESPRVTSICTMMHSGGHSEENEFSCRIGSGPPGSSEAQGDGAAKTYAKRFALCDALNIVVEGLDNDARLEGGPITVEQANELAERVSKLQVDVAKFLEFAGAKKFEEISSVKLEMLQHELSRKEKAQREGKK